jgi:hypothetical protein
MAKTYHTELIKCPNCNYKQYARVEHSLPFYSYVHYCDNCKYCIMESEWVQITLEKEVKNGI